MDKPAHTLTGFIIVVEYVIQFLEEGAMHLVIDVLTHPSTIVGMFGIAVSMLAVVFGQWRWHHSPIYQHIAARARQ